MKRKDGKQQYVVLVTVSMTHDDGQIETKSNDFEFFSDDPESYLERYRKRLKWFGWQIVEFGKIREI